MFVDLVVYVGICIFSISVLYPFWFLLVDSFSSPEASTTTGFNLWPKVTGRIDVDAEWDSYLERRARARGQSSTPP